MLLPFPALPPVMYPVRSLPVLPAPHPGRYLPCPPAPYPAGPRILPLW